MTGAAKKEAAPKPPADQGDETKPAKRGTAYKVVAPLIAVTVGEQVLQYSNGDILPNGIDGDSIERLSDLGFIAESE